MTFSVIDMCDAIADDLAPFALKAARAAGARTFLDWRYAPPDMLTPESAPWLAIYPVSTLYTLIDTDDGYEDDDDLEIQFAVAIGAEAELGGIGTPEIVKQVIVPLVAIVDQLRTYAGGLPAPFDNQVVGTLQATLRATDKALVWSQTSRLTVTNLGAE